MTELCWVWITDIDNVPPREGRAVKVAGRDLAIFNLGGGRFVATDGQCPHKGGPLADGIVSGETVVCPLHAWKISTVTGKVERPGGMTECVKTYPVRVDQGTIVVGLPSVTATERDGAAA
jgi:nitrite reductase (NADH) small subunit